MVVEGSMLYMEGGKGARGQGGKGRIIAEGI